MTKITREVLEKLRTIDTPTICNLVEHFKLRPHNTGYMDDRIKACFPEMPPMVGFALTATYRSSAPPPENSALTISDLAVEIEQMIKTTGPPVIVVQDLDDPTVAATFGEIMCTKCKVYGAVGLITSGAGRDINQVRSLEFPVFTSGTICAHAYCHLIQFNVPVSVGGLTVNPNDLLHGDLNGVTTIPNTIAVELSKMTDEYLANEKNTLAAIRSERKI